MIWLCPSWAQPNTKKNEQNEQNELSVNPLLHQNNQAV